MATEKELSEEDLKDVGEHLKSNAPHNIMSGIKSLPATTAGRLKKLKGLSSTKIREIDDYLGASSNKTAVLVADRDGYVPLKNRLTAWWNGENVSIVTKKPKRISSNTIEVSEDPHPDRWTSASVAMAQNIWGKGFAEPGGPTFAKKVLSLMKFEASNTILDLSAGLGGTACILAKEHNLWMDAYEANETLASSGLRFASRHGLSKKVPIQHMDFEELELPEKKYDQIYSRESLYMIKNKKNVIKQIAKALKHKGQILIIDYMLKENSNSDSVQKWLDSEPEKLHPWTAELYHTAMSHYGISVWSTNDLSEEYITQIHEGWLTMVEKVTNGDFDRKTVDALMREGEIWLNRARAIEAGDLTVKRIHGVV
jgi:ubiquinone/menaquinone biosynthesis C-methylase UbiE